MAGGNQGYGAEILPNPSAQSMQTLQFLENKAWRQQQFGAIQQQRELQRQRQAADFLDKNLNDKNYATGDPSVDPLISGMVSNSRAKFAKMIHENPNMDEGELEMQMQGDIGNISAYAQRIKGARLGIQEQAKRYQDMPGIDTSALTQGAIHNMLYQGGNSIVTDPNQIDPTKDYLQEQLQAHPELYVKGDDPIMQTINGYKPQKGGNNNISENKGVTFENKYSDTYYPWQQEVKDANGNVTGLQVRGTPAVLEGKTISDPQTGKPMQIVDNDTLQKFANTAVAANVKRDTDQYIKDHSLDSSKLQPGTDAYNIIARHVLYNKLAELTPSDYQAEHKKTDASIVTKMQLGMVDALGRTLSKADEHREQELLGTTNARVRQAANLDPDIVSAGQPFQGPGGRQLVDVTDAVGGFKTLADKKSGPTDIDPKTGQKLPDYKMISKILVDPNKPGSVFTMENGHLVEYAGKDVDALLTRHATANGYKSLSDVREINSKIPINPPKKAAKTADELGKQYGF